MVGFTVTPDVSSVLLHNTVDHGKTEPRTHSYSLGSVERLEDVSEGFVVHPESGILHGQEDVGSRLTFAENMF
jgi:hypothetical protein